jgi:enoyl-CoA hydratase/carnithine racemase
MALTPSAAYDLLRSPFALDDLGGGPPFVVDVRHAALELHEASATLRALACVTVAVVADPTDPPACTAPFDVVVVERGIDALVTAVRSNPIASVALVQLLRASATLDVGDALFAESATYAMLQSGPEFQGWLASRGPERATSAVEPAVVGARDGARMTLTLNRPAVHNAFNAAMRDELIGYLRAVAADPSITSVHLDGAGPSFCSGGDLDEFGTTPDPPTGHLVRSTRSPAWWLARCAEQTSVALHGACIGAGIELAAFARQVTATEDAFVQLPEVALGLIPGAGGTVSLPRRIGRQRTAWLALSGQRLDAATAHAWGLVDAVSGRPRRR